MELALAYPERVQKLVVADIAPVHYEHRHNDVFDGLRSISLEGLQSRVDADKTLAERVTEKAVRSFLLKNLQKGSDGRFQWRMNLEGLYSAYPELIRANRAGVWQGQTLFLKAEHSDYIQASHRDDILSRFPKTELKVVSGTGHWLHAEKPELIARLVSRFYQS
jgi:esterase